MRGMQLALLALTRVAPLLAQLHTVAAMLRVDTDKENTKISNKSLEFVNIIRADLRRNNDDYAAAWKHDRQNKLFSSPGAALPTRALPRRPPLTPGPPNRQLPIRPPPTHVPSIRPPPLRPPPYRGIPTRVPPNRAPLTPRPREPPKRDQLELPIDTRRALNDTKNQTSQASILVNATLFRSYTHPGKHFKKIRVDKLKRLIDKGKSRLRLSDRTGTTPMNGASPADGTSPAGGVGLPGSSTPPDAPPGSPTPTRPPHQQQPDNGWDRAAALRQHVKMGSPSPNQLDMAPARGPNIQLLRFKGRLCQRSVLFAEGPRYEAVGGARGPPGAPGRPLHSPAPAVVLPRCCNCCKKSVLGCQ